MAFNTNVKALIEKSQIIFGEAKDIMASMNELSEWNSIDEVIANMDKLNGIILRVISAIEVAAADLKVDYEGIKSGDKLEAASSLLDDAIKLPWYLEIIDGPAIKIAISMAIGLLNQTGDAKFGKEQALEILKGELFPLVGSLIIK